MKKRRLILLFFACLLAVLFFKNELRSGTPKNKIEQILLKDNFSFPHYFIFGVATSTFQESPNKYSAWYPRLADKHPEFFEGPQDFRLIYAPLISALKDSGINTIRISLEWPLIEPQEGRFNIATLTQATETIRKFQDQGLQVWICLSHFSDPIWFPGWENVNSAALFQRYVRVVTRFLTEALGRKTPTFWIVFNEPEVTVSQGYYKGAYPPFKKKSSAMGLVIGNLIRAHNKAYFTIHNILPKSQVASLPCCGGKWGNFIHTRMKRDYLPINFYGGALFGAPLNTFGRKYRHEKKQKGSPMYPAQLYENILRAKRYNLPIYITEIGISDSHDTQRRRYIIDILRIIHATMQEGADVRGVFHWTLIDNFEWDLRRYDARFGLIERTLGNMKTIPRKSFKMYSSIGQDFQITPRLIKLYEK